MLVTGVILQCGTSTESDRMRTPTTHRVDETLCVVVTIRQRWLGGDLKRLRLETGLTVQQVAIRIQVSESTVQRIERGDTPPKERVLHSLLELYGPDSRRAAVLIDLWHKARSRGWWLPYNDFAGVFVDLEDSAASIRSWQTNLVPGLLQTEEYARATIEAVLPDSPDNPRRVEFRVLRRTRFNQRPDPPDLHAILDEAVIRRQVGGLEVWRDQVGYLKKMAERPNITIQIVPFARGEHVGMVGPRVLLGFSNEDYPDVAYVETPAGDLYPEDELSLARFDNEWGRIAKAALTSEESAGMLADLL